MMLQAVENSHHSNYVSAKMRWKDEIHMVPPKTTYSSGEATFKGIKFLA